MHWWIWLIIVIVVLYVGIGEVGLRALNYDGTPIPLRDHIIWLLYWPIALFRG